MKSGFSRRDPAKSMTPTRRDLLKTASALAAIPMLKNFDPSSDTPLPRLTGSPVLDSLPPVIEHSRDVHTNVDKVREVASWMAYEDLPMPDYQLPFGIGQGSADDTIDFVMTADAVDTAFTDFNTHTKFQVDYDGRHWSDSDALFVCMKRAMDNGFPILDGKFLAQVTRPDLERIFAGNIEMPMLDPILRIRLNRPVAWVRSAGARVPNATVLNGTNTQPMPKPCIRPVRTRVACDTSGVKPVIR